MIRTLNVEIIQHRRPQGLDAAMEEIEDILCDPLVTYACLTLFREKGYRFE